MTVFWLGGSDSIASRTELSPDEVRSTFDAIVAALESDAGYGVWFLPVLGARVPAGGEPPRRAVEPTA